MTAYVCPHCLEGRHDWCLSGQVLNGHVVTCHCGWVVVDKIRKARTERRDR